MLLFFPNEYLFKGFVAACCILATRLFHSLVVLRAQALSIHYLIGAIFVNERKLKKVIKNHRSLPSDKL